MRHEFSLTIEFEASHVVERDPLCGTLHGHRWIAEAIVEGTPLTRDQDVANLRAALDQVRKELHRRDLSVMLPGTITNTVGVGHWIYERLVMKFPIVTLKVSADGVTSILHRR